MYVLLEMVIIRCHVLVYRSVAMSHTVSNTTSPPKSSGEHFRITFQTLELLPPPQNQGTSSLRHSSFFCSSRTKRSASRGENSEENQHQAVWQNEPFEDVY